MKVDIANVEHGACAFIVPPTGGRLAMVDCGHNDTTNWRPSTHFKNVLGRDALDYLFITNADHDHYSDLHDFVATVSVHRFYRNWRITTDQFLEMKKESGPLSEDAKSYASLTQSHVYSESSVPEFNQGMGGIRESRFGNAYGYLDDEFTDTNNLSMAIFLSYNGFQILFPGDLQVPGWKALLKDAAFRAELQKTTILVASHHGRYDGFSAEVFDYCQPQAVVISDKEIMHETQEGMASLYGAMLCGDGIMVNGNRRKVLTTRSDGNIRFDVGATHYTVETHYAE